MTVVGVDIAKTKFDALVLHRDGSNHHRVFDNNRAGFRHFKRWLSQHGAKRAAVCMEATGYYYLDLADFLHAAKYPVHVVNPNRIKAYADSQLRRNKTDKLDAALIADFCQTQQPPLWTPPTETERELLALVRRYNDIQQTLQAEKNRLAAGIPSQTVQQDIRDHLAFLERKLTDLKRQIEHFIQRHPDLQQQAELLCSIPGISLLTAARLLAEIPRWRDFDDVRQLVAFAGLNPKHRDSGRRRSSYTPISKQGSASLRLALYMPALASLRCNPIIVRFAQRLRDNGVSGKPLVVAIMRKLLHLAFGILKSGQPFDPDFLEKRTAIA